MTANTNEPLGSEEPASSVDDLRRRIEELQTRLAEGTRKKDQFKKAAERLAQQFAEEKVRVEKARADLMEEHDAFIAELARDHDRLVNEIALERDEARHLVNEAVATRDGVAQASKRVARQRTEARRELGEVALERDIAQRDAARATRQLADARKEIERLRRELASMEVLRTTIPSDRPTQPPPPAELEAAVAESRRSSQPPSRSEGDRPSSGGLRLPVRRVKAK